MVYRRLVPEVSPLLRNEGMRGKERQLGGDLQRQPAAGDHGEPAQRINPGTSLLSLEPKKASCP